MSSHPLIVPVAAFLTALNLGVLIRGRLHPRDDRVGKDRSLAMTHAARLLLAGEIAAAVVHEVIQPLSAILSNVEAAELLLRQSNPDLEPVREILADVRKDDLRAREIVHRLRTLLRQRELQLENVDINAIVEDAVSLIMPHARGRNVIVCTTLNPELPAVPADPIHLQQVVLNLLLNGIDAMNDTPATDRRIDVHCARGDGAWVKISVLDNGHGIAPKRIDKVFDPFFTTKADGMGLGLPIARHIVQRHGGEIWAENRTRGGAVFSFTVPLGSVV